MSSRARAWWPVVSTLAFAALMSGGLVLLTSDGEDAETTALQVTSDAPRRDSVDELVAASDLVVRARVAGIESGRAFGEPGHQAVLSRVVTLEIDEVLRGNGTPGARLLLEEEATLADGTPIVVDGLVPAPVGADGVWFLRAVPGAEVPTYIVVSAQGRYLGEGDELTGAVGDDPLVDEIESLGVEGLVTEVRGAVPPTAP